MYCGADDRGAFLPDPYRHFVVRWPDDSVTACSSPLCRGMRSTTFSRAASRSGTHRSVRADLTLRESGYRHLERSRAFDLDRDAGDGGITGEIVESFAVGEIVEARTGRCRRDRRAHAVARVPVAVR